MLFGKYIKPIKEDHAVATAILDNSQASLDRHRHLLSEETAWNLQAEIDIQRYDIEMQKLDLHDILFCR